MNKYTEVLFEVLAERGIEVTQRGEWLDVPDEWFNSVRCSRCQCTILKKDKTRFCGYCGADMRKLR